MRFRKISISICKPPQWPRQQRLPAMPSMSLTSASWTSPGSPAKTRELCKTTLFPVFFVHPFLIYNLTFYNFFHTDGDFC